MNLYVAVESCLVCVPEGDRLNVIGVFEKYEEALGECKEPECEDREQHLYRVQAIEAPAPLIEYSR